MFERIFHCASLATLCFTAALWTPLPALAADSAQAATQATLQPTIQPVGQSPRQVQGQSKGPELVCRPAKPGEVANAYALNPSAFSTDQSSPQGRAAQSTAPQGAIPHAQSPSQSLGQASASARSPAPLPPSPQSNPQSSPQSNPQSSPQSSPQSQNTPAAQGYYRLCPAPPAPTEPHRRGTLSKQIYAEPPAVAAAWDCYAPRAMAYAPRPWLGPDPAMHSPLPSLQRSARPARQNPAPAQTNAQTTPTQTPDKATEKAQPYTHTASPSAHPAGNPALSPSPESQSQTPAPAQNPAQSAATPNKIPVPTQYYRPNVMGGQSSMAAPLVAPSPSTAQQQPSAAPENIAPENQAQQQIPQRPESLLTSPPLPPNALPRPPGFS